MLPLRIGQSAVGRFAPANSLLQRVKFVGRVGIDPHSTATLSIRFRPAILCNGFTFQGYATQAPASKPKAHTGRATTRKKASTTKKASKSTPSKRKTTKKPVQRSVKPVRKPRVKKVLSPEDKQKQQIRELRIKALRPPHGRPATAWTVLMSEVAKNSSAVVSGSKEASVKYKNLLPEEREHYNHVANENKTKNQAAYKSWVESFTPDQIRVANNARLQLRRLTGRGRNWVQLHDDRKVKRPASARNLFTKDRWASGDFNGMKVTDVPPLLTREWNALTAAEKKAYEDQYAQSKTVYTAEKARVYGTTTKVTRQRRTKDSTAATAQLQREANA